MLEHVRKRSEDEVINIIKALPEREYHDMVEVEVMKACGEFPKFDTSPKGYAEYQP